MFRRSGSSSWYAAMSVGGCRKWISLRTSNRKEAQAREARLRFGNLPEVVRLIASPPAIPVGDLFAEFVKGRNLAPSTTESHHAVFARFHHWFGGAVASDVTLAVAERYLATIGNARTANLARGVLSSIWRASGQPDPWRQARTRKQETQPFRPFTDGEVVAILGKADAFWRLAVMISFYSGLRFKDVVNLRRSQFGPGLAYIELVPAKTKRTGRAVYIPLHPELRKELDRYKGRGDVLFPEQAKTYAQSRQVLVRRFRKLVVAAGIKAGDGKRVGFHSLRATFATRAKKAGVPLNDLRAFLGHTTTAMSSHYVDDPSAVSLAAYPALDTPTDNKLLTANAV